MPIPSGILVLIRFTVGGGADGVSGVPRRRIDFSVLLKCLPSEFAAASLMTIRAEAGLPRADMLHTGV